ncbi:MAG TPA: orotidine-5'-phosphate decarboxylase [Verrucomicrobiota bacterium]|jgi:orotidine-5'-phosphate decarboxylase|nr:orotidine-5'-phosphate decarboxylase [Verrucomicrobiota bacterium]OQC24729.1 MAG: Orotidine 5'-phosphate decarboxylase [Verrucomicrobia bacterium ADurb.Bin063]HRR65033.1 orotidine-5'-phosphate decarboxylase [Candidatus Paceibacterota bacterium]MBP8016014.1 orotidine-5'-phosphate decarboxylase [Verrucomicrobiota bacterium]MDI9373971.1 orotidine-5'-phosphate decarboxylase [Verrucomicrobiota bacterium]
MRNPILAALDVPTADEALRLVRQLAPVCGGFKVGSELFTAAGPGIVRQIRGQNAAVFLDLKFHDIPHTVARAVAAATRLGVQMLTVHAGGGRSMLQAAEQAARETAAQMGQPPPLVLGVTVLTSLDDEALGQIGCEPHAGRQVLRLAQLAAQAGLRGLVCSPHEITELRQSLPSALQLVIPGIRPGTVAGDDQKRTLTPRAALARGANWLVIGRPICAAPNPRAAAEQILNDLASP